MPVYPGQRIRCLVCSGRGYVTGGGALPSSAYPKLCPGCEGSGMQEVVA